MMRFLGVLAAVFLWASHAFAVCPTTPTDCASPTFNNLTIATSVLNTTTGANLLVKDAGGTVMAEWGNSPTLSGQLVSQSLVPTWIRPDQTINVTNNPISLHNDVVTYENATWTGNTTTGSYWAQNYWAGTFHVQFGLGDHIGNLTLDSHVGGQTVGAFYNLDSEVNLDSNLSWGSCVSPTSTCNIELHGFRAQVYNDAYTMYGSSGNPLGFLIGGKVLAGTSGTASYIKMVASLEDQVNNTDPTTQDEYGAYIADIGTAQAVNESDGLLIGAQSSTPGFKIGIMFGSTDNPNISGACGTVACTLISARNAGSTVNYAMDWSNLTVVDAYYKDPHTQLTAAGEIIASALPTSAPATHCAVWVNSGVLTLTTCP